MFLQLLFEAATIMTHTGEGRVYSEWLNESDTSFGISVSHSRADSIHEMQLIYTMELWFCICKLTPSRPSNLHSNRVYVLSFMKFSLYFQGERLSALDRSRHNIPLALHDRGILIRSNFIEYTGRHHWLLIDWDWQSIARLLYYITIYYTWKSEMRCACDTVSNSVSSINLIRELVMTLQCA